MALALGMLVALSPGPRAWAEQPDDATQLAALEAISPEAVPIFVAASQARDANNFAEAARLYGEVVKLAPDFSHALRRQCISEARLYNRDRALELCAKAIAVAGTSSDHVAMAYVLMRPPSESGWTSDQDVIDAHKHIERAIELDPDNVDAYEALCRVGMSRTETVYLRQCTTHLHRLAPERVNTHLFTMYLAMKEDDLDLAKASLDRANALGMSEQMYLMLNAEITSRRPVYHWWLLSMRFVVPWMLLMGCLLFGAAWWLGRWSGGLAPRLALEPELAVRTRRRRRFYLGLLWFGTMGFYVVTPLLVLAAGVVVVAMVHTVLSREILPALEMGIISGLMLLTLGWFARHILVRPGKGDPGLPLPFDAHPGLRDAAGEVAEALEAAPIEAAYLVPGHRVEIISRGRMIEQLEGGRQRALLLGTEALDTLSVQGLRAALALEYGLYSRRDTGRGAFAGAVRRALDEHLGTLKDRGTRWTNPTWLSMKAFSLLFWPVSLGAVRFQDALRARWAAELLGAPELAPELARARAAEAFPAALQRLIPPGADDPGAWSLLDDPEALRQAASTPPAT